MSLRLTALEPAKAGAWESAYAAVDHATFFHSPAWAEVWRVHTASRIHPVPMQARFSDGVSAFLPASVEVQLHGLMRRVHLSPGGTYGGPLSESTLDDEHSSLLLATLSRRYGGVTWRAGPADPASGWLGARPGSQADTTHVVDLRMSAADRKRRWSKGHTAAAKRAEREGVRVRRAASVDDWDAYYQLYLGRLRHWGARASSVYPRAFFTLLAALTDVTLWLATHEDRVIAGAVCLYSARHVAYWHGAADDASSKLQPAHLALRTAMDAAADTGHWWFDYLPSGENAGVAAFKHGFGAVEMPAPVYRRDGLGARLHGLVRR